MKKILLCSLLILVTIQFISCGGYKCDFCFDEGRVRCGWCGGSGLDHITCYECDGTGYEIYRFGDGTSEKYKCYKCRGKKYLVPQKGERGYSPCNLCQGTGQRPCDKCD